MRILFISNLYPNPIFPTMASYNRQQIKALSQYAEVEVISPVPWTACLKKKLEPTFYISDGITVHHPVYYYTPRFFRKQYGLFFYHSIKAIAIRLLEKNNYDIIYSSWLYPDAWAAARLAQKYKVPLFVKVHGSDVNLLQPGSVITRKSLSVVEQAQQTICVSRALQDRLISLGAAANKLKVVYNGVDRSIFRQMDKQEVRRSLNIPSDDFVVLFVGNLKKDKGLDELVTAFKLLQVNVNCKSSHLVIIGSGIYGAQSKRQVTELGLEHKVRFLGSQSLVTIAQWMNAASVLCLPSYMEGVPNVVLEALSCGTRVIATNVGGIPELDNGDGSMQLIPPRQSSPLADAFAVAMECVRAPILNTRIVSWQQNAEYLYSIFAGKS